MKKKVYILLGSLLLIILCALGLYLSGRFQKQGNSSDPSTEIPHVTIKAPDQTQIIPSATPSDGKKVTPSVSPTTQKSPGTTNMASPTSVVPTQTPVTSPGTTKPQNPSLSKTISFAHRKNTSQYTLAMVKEDFNTSIRTGEPILDANLGHDKNLSIDTDGNLTFRMPQGKIWTDGSGGQITMPIKAADAYTLEYEVKFDGAGQPYDFTSGGKLPGLGGGVVYTGGTPARKGDGFSGRFMFGYNVRQIFGYIYHKDMTGAYGESLGLKKTNAFRDNQFTKIRIYYKLNKGKDPAISSSDSNEVNTLNNGVLKAWFDLNDGLGFQEMQSPNNKVRFMTYDKKIDKLLLTSFHGGASDDYRPNHTQFIKFKYIKLTSGS